MRLLIKYATRGRQRQFIDALQNIKATIGTDNSNYQIIVSADEDDMTMKDCNLIDQMKFYHNVKLLFGESTSKVGAINRDIPSTDTWDWCLVMSDDMTFVVGNWYDKMIADIKSVWGDSTDFFAHFSDGYVHDKLPTMNICGVDYYKRFGYIYHPSYGSVSCDAENFFVAQMLGKHHYFPQVYFKHDHPSNLRTKPDQTYRDNDRFGDADTKNYFERIERLFDVKDPVMIPEQLRKELAERNVFV